MAFKVTTAPAAEPVTLSEAKEHLKIDVSDEDTLITNAITAAREWLEDHTGLKFYTQTITEYWDKFYSDCLELSAYPVQSVTSVKYIDLDGVEQTINASNYKTDNISRPCRIETGYGVNFPSTRLEINAVYVEYIAGYGAADDIPERIKSAIKLLVGLIYENREDFKIKQKLTDQRAAEYLVEHLIDFSFA
jgi:uncharacterized phiE125 gp8 family phage protein